MTSLGGSSRSRFGVIAVVVMSVIVVSCLTIKTADAARSKRDSDNRVLIDILTSLWKEEEAHAHFGNRKLHNAVRSGSKSHLRRVRRAVVASYIEAPNCGTPAITPNLNSNASNLIVGGVEAKPNSWPWQCSLQVNNGSAYVHRCGCSVMSNANVVITAAHCVVNNNIPYSEDVFKVVCGIQNLNQSYNSPAVQVASVSQIFVNDNFRTAHPLDNDIALLVLSTPLVFSQTVSPICLPTYNPSTADTLCYVTGWGLSQENNTPSGNVLHQVNMPVFNQSVCNQTYQNGLTNDVLCAYKPEGSDPCQGDSGGPFVCLSGGKWYLQGVVSLGYGCTRAGSPGIYTRVFSYVQWIEGILGGITVSTGDLSTPSTTNSTTSTPSSTTTSENTSSTTTTSITTPPSSTTTSETTTSTTTTSISTPPSSTTALTTRTSTTKTASLATTRRNNGRDYDSGSDESSDDDDNKSRKKGGSHKRRRG